MTNNQKLEEENMKQSKEMEKFDEILYDIVSLTYNIGKYAGLNKAPDDAIGISGRDGKIKELKQLISQNFIPKSEMERIKKKEFSNGWEADKEKRI